MSFRIRLWPTFFSVIGLALLVSLGSWQLSRFFDARAFEEQRDAKMDLPMVSVDSTEALSSGDLDFRRIEVEGVWDERYLFLIKHRVYQGTPGYWVVSPLHLTSRDESTALLVNRGWISIEDGPGQARQLLDTNDDEVISVTGLVHFLDDVVVDQGFHQRLDDSSKPDGIIELESYDPTAIYRVLGAEDFDRPIVLTESPDPSREDADPVASYDHITEPYLTAETHFGYMLTWYFLALALIAIWIAHGLGLLASPAYEERDERVDRSP